MKLTKEQKEVVKTLLTNKVASNIEDMEGYEDAYECFKNGTYVWVQFKSFYLKVQIKEYRIEKVLEIDIKDLDSPCCLNYMSNWDNNLDVIKNSVVYAMCKETIESETQKEKLIKALKPTKAIIRKAKKL